MAVAGETTLEPNAEEAAEAERARVSALSRRERTGSASRRAMLASNRAMAASSAAKAAA
jgi:hypothetical protein